MEQPEIRARFRFSLFDEAFGCIFELVPCIEACYFTDIPKNISPQVIRYAMRAEVLHNYFFPPMQTLHVPLLPLNHT